MTLTPSAELAELLRLAKAVGEAFPERRSELEPKAQRVSRVFLEEVESTRGVVLPDDVVILATLRMSAFVRAVGLDLPGLAGPRRDCAGDFGAPRGWVDVASFGQRAMSESVREDDLGLDTLLAVAARPPTRSGDPPIRIIDGPGSIEKTTLARFVRERLARRYGTRVEYSSLVEAARTGGPVPDSMIVTVVDDAPPPPVERRVVHAKFGEGRVLREIEDEKLEISFDSGATKTLHRSFVRDL